MNQTQSANYYAWRIGQYARVRFARRGSQLAQCRGFTREGLVLAKKYSAKSGRWTKTNIVVTPEEFLHFEKDPSHAK